MICVCRWTIVAVVDGFCCTSPNVSPCCVCSCLLPRARRRRAPEQRLLWRRLERHMQQRWLVEPIAETCRGGGQGRVLLRGVPLPRCWHGVLQCPCHWQCRSWRTCCGYVLAPLDACVFKCAAVGAVGQSSIPQRRDTALRIQLVTRHVYGSTCTLRIVYNDVLCV